MGARIFEHMSLVTEATPLPARKLNSKRALLVLGIFLTFFGIAATTKEILGCITLPLGGILYLLGTTTSIFSPLIEISKYFIMAGVFITVTALIFLIPAKEELNKDIGRFHFPKWKTWRTRRTFFQLFVYGIIIFHILLVASGKSSIPSICPQSFTDLTLTGSFGIPFLFWIAVFLLVLLFGRALCSWVCVYTPVQEQSALLLTAAGKNPNNKKFNHRKLIYVITAIFWGGIIFNVIRNLDKLNFKMGNGLDVGPLWLFFAGIVTMFPITVFLTHYFGNRSFCKYLCPLGGLMGVYSKFGLLKIKMDKEKCTNCKRCDKNCQMGVEIEKYRTNGGVSIKDGNCIVCGDCIDSCPSKALKFGIGG